MYGGPSDGRYSERIVGTVNDRSLDIADDGTFSLILSPDPHDGAWIKLEPDAVCAITRDYLADPSSGARATWPSRRSIRRPPAGRTTPTWPAASGPRSPGSGTRPRSSRSPSGTPNTVDEPYPVPSETFGWAAGDAAYAMGSFALDEDEALVIEGRSPPCAFWNVCLWNQFLHTYDYAYERVTLNGDPGRPTRTTARGGWWSPHGTPATPTGSPRPAIRGDGSGSAGSSPSRTPDRPTTRVVRIDASSEPAAGSPPDQGLEGSTP